MVDIVSSRQGVQIGLSIPEMPVHIGPSFVNAAWLTIPETKVLLEDGFLRQKDIGHI